MSFLFLSLREQQKPTWGTCAGLILLAEAANDTKKGGQDLIGGLAVRVHRNHFGRQVESFVADLDLPFLSEETAAGAGANGTATTAGPVPPFSGVFIRAPIVEALLEPRGDDEAGEVRRRGPVEIMGVLPRRRTKSKTNNTTAAPQEPSGDAAPEDADHVIIAVRQDNLFGTSFHPELTDDPRIHVWWLKQVLDVVMG